MVYNPKTCTPWPCSKNLEKLFLISFFLGLIILGFLLYLAMVGGQNTVQKPASHLFAFMLEIIGKLFILKFYPIQYYILIF